MGNLCPSIGDLLGLSAAEDIENEIASANALLDGLSGGAGTDYANEFALALYVEVNEHGTEAAAATAVQAVRLGLPPEQPRVAEFRADRSFLFMLCDLRTGAIVCIGRVIDPTAG